MKKNLLYISLLLIATNQAASQSAVTVTDSSRMAWWKDAKFGMFIHWGVYAVLAGTYDGKKIPGIGEWIMNRGKIPVDKYKPYAQQFNPVKYNPEAWVKMAKDAGIKYIVITSKHHDGFALFNSTVTDWDVVDATSADSTFIARVDLKTLPDSLQNKSREEIGKIVKAKSKERSDIQKQILTLNAQRQKFLVEERQKNSANKNTQTLETATEKIIRQQASKFNMTIEQ